jgi:hypothetical protein
VINFNMSFGGQTTQKPVRGRGRKRGKKKELEARSHQTLRSWGTGSEGEDGSEG